MMQKSAKKLRKLLLDSGTKQVINQLSFHSTEVCKYFLLTCLHLNFKINNFVYVTENFCSLSKVGNTRNTHYSKSHCCRSQFNDLTIRLLSFILNWLIEGFWSNQIFPFFLFFPSPSYLCTYIYAKVLMNCNCDSDFCDGVSSKLTSAWCYGDIMILKIKSDIKYKRNRICYYYIMSKSE